MDKTKKVMEALKDRKEIGPKNKGNLLGIMAKLTKKRKDGCGGPGFDLVKSAAKDTAKQMGKGLLSGVTLGLSDTDAAKNAAKHIGGAIKGGVKGAVGGWKDADKPEKPKDDWPGRWKSPKHPNKLKNVLDVLGKPSFSPKDVKFNQK